MDLEWKIPPVWNAFERNRGRAYHLALTTVVAFDNWLIGLDLLKQGKDKIHTPFEVPRKGMHIGAGFWGAGRGYLTHHAVIDDGALSNYQILTPSTWNACPRDPWGSLGISALTFPREEKDEQRGAIPLHREICYNLSNREGFVL
jgi:hydrogenase large subunit